jgi:ubiquinone biosynthesis protein UbiJ
MQLSTSTYLTEAAGYLPAEEEVNHYLDQVDALRMSVDRLEAIINHYIEKERTNNK